MDRVKEMEDEEEGLSTQSFLKWKVRFRLLYYAFFTGFIILLACYGLLILKTPMPNLFILIITTMIFFCLVGIVLLIFWQFPVTEEQELMKSPSKETSRISKNKLR